MADNKSKKNLLNRWSNWPPGCKSYFVCCKKKTEHSICPSFETPFYPIVNSTISDIFAKNADFSKKNQGHSSEARVLIFFWILAF